MRPTLIDVTRKSPVVVTGRKYLGRLGYINGELEQRQNALGPKGRAFIYFPDREFPDNMHVVSLKKLKPITPMDRILLGLPVT